MSNASLNLKLQPQDILVMGTALDEYEGLMLAMIEDGLGAEDLKMINDRMARLAFLRQALIRISD